MKAKPFILFGLSVVLLLATSMFSCVRGQEFGLIGSTGFAHGCVQLDDIRGEDGNHITDRKTAPTLSFLFMQAQVTTTSRQAL